MGLDMYLNVKKYVNQNDGWGADAVRRPEYDAVVKAAGLDKFTKDESVSIYGANVSVTAAYWRKANHIHKWFVDNIQDGVDNCQESYVGLEALQELVDICKTVLENKGNTTLAEELLPVHQGFFFGGYEYDEWYYGDIEYTRDRLTEIIKMIEDAHKNDVWFDVTYQASW